MRLAHRAGRNVLQNTFSKLPKLRHGLNINDPNSYMPFDGTAIAIRRQTGWVTDEDDFTPGFDMRRLEEALDFGIDWSASYMNLDGAALRVWRQGSWYTDEDDFSAGFGFRTLE